MKGIVALLFCLAATACAPGEPATAHITFSMSPSVTKLSKAVATEMEVFVGERFLNSPRFNFQIRVTLAPAGVSYLGLAYVPEDYDENCSIKMSAKLLDPGYYTLNDYRLVLMHEIGHCFGLSHTQDPRDIMYAYYESGQVDDASMNRFYQQLDAARVGRR
jgi:catalase (peroxidase I)